MNEKEKQILEEPFVLKCSNVKDEIAYAVNRAKENGVPFTVICEILTNITNQANEFALQEQSRAMAYYQKQKQELDKNKNCEN